MATRAFDDGRDGIPAAAPGAPTRVIVVGAGIAGLTAANALTTAGIDAVVIEARDRIGGRAAGRSRSTASVADLGGAWVHHPGHGNVLADWVEFAGVPYVVDPNGTAFSAYDMGERRALSGAELDGVGYVALDPVEAIVAADTAAGRPDRSAEAVIEEYLATLPAGAERDRLPAAHGLDDRAGRRGGARRDLVALDLRRAVARRRRRRQPRGRRLPQRARAARGGGSTIRLGRAVQRIAHDGSGVVVSGEGWEERGSHVLVTVPLGVLQHGAIEFVPPLPPERTAVIERAGFGHMEKVVVAFAEPWWQAEHGLNHAVVYPADRREAAAWTWDYGRRSINFLVATSAIPTMWRDPLGWALAQLEAMYGPLPQQPTGWTHTEWLHDEYAYGSYSHVRTGWTDEDMESLGEPVGRVLFAGEHTNGPRGGYADGGMLSGLREAKRLLQRGLRGAHRAVAAPRACAAPASRPCVRGLWSRPGRFAQAPGETAHRAVSKPRCPHRDSNPGPAD